MCGGFGLLTTDAKPDEALPPLTPPSKPISPESVRTEFNAKSILGGLGVLGIIASAIRAYVWIPDHWSGLPAALAAAGATILLTGGFALGLLLHGAGSRAQKSCFLIGGLAAVLIATAFGLGTSDHPVMANADQDAKDRETATIATASDSIKFEIEPIPQRVNKKTSEGAEAAEFEDVRDVEFSTIMFRVVNSGSKRYVANSAAILIDEVHGVTYEARTLMRTRPIDHSAHISVWLENPTKGASLPVEGVPFVIPADLSHSFTLWFKSRLPKGVGILRVRALLKLDFDEGDGPATSQPFEIVIHDDSAEMHY